MTIPKLTPLPEGYENHHANPCCDWMIDNRPALKAIIAQQDASPTSLSVEVKQNGNLIFSASNERPVDDAKQPTGIYEFLRIIQTLASGIICNAPSAEISDPAESILDSANCAMQLLDKPNASDERRGDDGE